jgi:hypothetical protein
MIDGKKSAIRPGRMDISKVHEQYTNFHRFVVEQFEVYRQHPISYKQYFVSKDAVYEEGIHLIFFVNICKLVNGLSHNFQRKIEFYQFLLQSQID